MNNVDTVYIPEHVIYTLLKNKSEFKHVFKYNYTLFIYIYTYKMFNNYRCLDMFLYRYIFIHIYIYIYVDAYILYIRRITNASINTPKCFL